ncbi:hypothetical protein D3C76_1095850 [compost metagenome]
MAGFDPAQLAVAEFEVAVDAGDFLGQADARAGDLLSALGHGVEGNRGKGRHLAGFHELGVGGVQVAREHLRQLHLTLGFGDRTFDLDGDRASIHVSWQARASTCALSGKCLLVIAGDDFLRHLSILLGW